MAKYSVTNWKNCATCEFWDGPRVSNEELTVVDESAGGKCTLHGSGATKYPTNTCVGWRRWADLIAQF